MSEGEGGKEKGGRGEKTPLLLFSRHCQDWHQEKKKKKVRALSPHSLPTAEGGKP